MQSTGEAGVPVQSVDAHLEEEKEEDESKYPTGVALWAVLVPVTIGYFLYFLDTCIVATASPAITLRFDSLIDIGWYGGAYQLGNSAVRPLTGKMYSHFNTKVRSSRVPWTDETAMKGRGALTVLTTLIVDVSSLLLPFRTWLSHLWRSSFVAYVHFWQSSCRRWRSRNRHWCSGHHIVRVTS